ncbi:hypothetical protein D1BOALGB6SA_10658 [Olavius sp. associated proteobacterium Delta 1]|nr:hypothetical protein D1BOALGB6SA_10658 [Olavius sp. associated proteobacterium Delta 1]
MDKEKKSLSVENKDEKIEDDPQSGDVIIPEEVFEKIPPEARGEIKRMVSTISAGYIGPTPSPIARKLTSDHVTKIIDNSEKEDQRRYQEKKEERKMSLIVFGGILVPVTGLIVFFALIDKVEILIPLISAIVAFGGGYGFGKSRK